MNMEKLYGGIDIHKEKLAGCIMDKDGNITREHIFPSSKEAVERFLCDIPNSELTIAIEACGMWRGTYKILTEMGYRVKLANPKKTHDIACKKKTDKIDAKILADLLRTKYLPEVWIPDEQTLRFRDLTRHKSTITRLIVQIQGKIKGYLLRKGTKYSKLWNEKTLSELAKEDPDIKNLVTIYRSLKNEEKDVMKRIQLHARTMKETTLLMSTPGIAEFSSLMILAEIGDIKRFPSPKELVNYAGLCCGIYQTGSTERSVRNTAVNKWLKWIIYECSGRAIMLDPKFQEFFYRINQRKGYNTTRRATARKMLTILWYMLTNEEPYRAS
jgi:transposase